MRFIIPLFNFEYEGDEYQFQNDFCIKNFDVEKDIPADIEGLSVMERTQIGLENWALVIENPNIENFMSDLNLLFIAFRIYGKSNAFYKWRFCNENRSHNARLNEYFRNILVNTNNLLTFDDLSKINEGFIKLLNMYSVSNRTKNALYFIWRGLSSFKHMDSYIFLVCALESLFSGETAEDVTKTLINRTKSFLKGIKGCGGDRIKSIYKIRSDMVHGRICHIDKNDETGKNRNLDNLGKLEVVIFSCLYKFLENKIYKHYCTTKDKEKYLNTL